MPFQSFQMIREYQKALNELSDQKILLSEKTMKIVFPNLSLRIFIIEKLTLCKYFLMKMIFYYAIFCIKKNVITQSINIFLEIQIHINIR